METTTKPKRRGRRNSPLPDPPNRLHELRLAGEYSLKEIGAVCTATDERGVSAPTIFKAEAFGTGLSMDNWFKIADFLGVDPRDLCRPPEK